MLSLVLIAMIDDKTLDFNLLLSSCAYTPEGNLLNGPDFRPTCYREGALS